MSTCKITETVTKGAFYCTLDAGHEGNCKAAPTEDRVLTVPRSLYPKPSLTVDCVVIDGANILLIQRGDEPFEGCWALPGGFVNEGEEPIVAAKRELLEETGLCHPGLGAQHLIDVFGAAGRDPRGWVVSIAYKSFVFDRNLLTLKAGDDAAAAKWQSIDAVLSGDIPLAFDHLKIIQRAVGF